MSAAKNNPKLRSAIDIEEMIPHRAPFLFVDSASSLDDGSIETLCEFSSENDIYKGHYPGFPITPGALILEAIFQSGAVLLGARLAEDGKTGVPVVTKIEDARFKNVARPDQTITINVKLDETISNAFYMSGAAKIADRLIARAKFVVALVDRAALEK